MTALLLLDLCGGVLAHPEQPGTEQDRFVGFHLVYEPAPLPGEERNIEDEHWVEYGTQTLDGGTLRLLREDTLTAGEAMDLGGTWTLPWAEGAAYTLAVKHNSDGTWTFNLFPGPYREG